MKCNICGTENPAELKSCRNCGNDPKMKSSSLLSFKKILPIFIVIVVALLVSLVWYYSKPILTIKADKPEVCFDHNGGTVEIPITTNADDSQWHAEERGNMDVELVKKNKSLIINVDYYYLDPDEYEEFSDNILTRYSLITLYCDGRNDDRYYIIVKQTRKCHYVKGDPI